MIEKISRPKAYVDKMRQKGNVTTFNRPEDIQVSININENLEQFRREHQVKDRKSQVVHRKLF